MTQANSGQFAIPQDHTDATPVINVPASAVHPAMAMPQPGQTNQPTLTPIVVDGETKMMTQEQLVEWAQKGVSSGSRYQEAAAKSKEAEAAIAFKADMDLLGSTGDISAFRRLGASMNMTGDEVEEAARLVYEQMDDQTTNPNADNFDENSLYNRGTVQSSPGRDGPIADRMARIEAQLVKTTALLEGRNRTKFQDLDDTLQTVVVDVEQSRVDRIIQKALDSDQVLAYYMNSYDDKGQQAIRDMIDEKVRGRLDASDSPFGDGARILNEVVPEVRTTLEALGTSSRLTPQLGLGPAPGGPGEANIYPTKDPEPVSSQDAGFDEHITEVMARNMFKASGG